MATRVFDRSDLIGATLRKVDLFAKWPADVIAQMATAAQLWRYAKGESVYQAGTPPAGVFILVDGSLFVRRSWPNGKQMATTISRPGWPNGVMAAWDGIEYPYDGVARSDLHAVLVPRASFLVAARGDPKRIEDLLNFASTQSRQDIEALHTRAIGSLRCLMAKYLAYLSRPSMHLSLEEPDAVDPGAFDVTQDELAAMLHTSRQTVNQLMKAMEREGVLKREGNRLRIVNFLKLLAIMEEDEPVHPAWRDQIVAWNAKLQTMDAKNPGGARDSVLTIR
ncbi:MAG TPA: Crp/Fnr family transcriptional regulator [Rhizomicrobium sp.]|nr:Crp/Fnr family transcriptional regulator [Rhizomicrobium sp.]